jgi:di/tripeptidase
MRESSLSVILRSEATKNLANNLSILRINSATEESNQNKVCEELRFFATLRMTKNDQFRAQNDYLEKF